MSRQHSPDPLRPDDRKSELNRRYLARERLKVIGLLVIAAVLLGLAFLRFGKTIPWGAR